MVVELVVVVDEVAGATDVEVEVLGAGVVGGMVATGATVDVVAASVDAAASGIPGSASAPPHAATVTAIAIS